MTTKTWAWLVLKRVWLQHIKGIAVMKSAWSRKKSVVTHRIIFFSIKEYVNITNIAVRVLKQMIDFFFGFCIHVCVF